MAGTISFFFGKNLLNNDKKELTINIMHAILSDRGEKMDMTVVQKLARVLNVLVTITFVCNLIALLLVPGLVGIGQEGGMEAFRYLTSYENPLEVPLRLAALFFMVCWQFLWRIWRDAPGAVLTVFLWFCGICTAVILWQGRRVLGTILTGAPFRAENGVSLRRAALCCFLISAAALARVVWGLFYYRSAAPLLTYNALFVPIFLMAGLLCMVMSALFRQAAELKEENDLTI